MYSHRTPTVDYLKNNISSVPNDLRQVDLEGKVGMIQRSIVEYYRQNPEFSVLSFELLDDSGNILHSTDSLVGRPPNNQSSINSIKLTSYFFSEYSDNCLTSLGLNVDDMWNGKITFVVYNEGDALIGKTDYYSHCVINQLLQIEAFHVMSNSENGISTQDFPVRNELLRSKSDFFIKSALLQLLRVVY